MTRDQTHPEYERFVSLLTANQRRILGLIRSQVMSFEDAEDVMQEACIVLWRKFEDYKAGTDFAAWALQVARFEVLSHWKREQRRRRMFSPQTLDQLADDAVALRDEIDDRRDALRICMEKLEGPDRELIRLRYADALVPHAIAEQRDQSVWAVYRRLQRIHARLLECIERRLAGDAP